MRLVRNRPTPEGRALGAQLVRMTESEVMKLAAEGESDLRCASCAFRLGTFPNGCPETVMDALKCVLEGAPFLCHERFLPPEMAEGPRHRDLCHGWYAARVGMDGKTVKAWWPWSHKAAEPGPVDSTGTPE